MKTQFTDVSFITWGRAMKIQFTDVSLNTLGRAMKFQFTDIGFITNDALRLRGRSSSKTPMGTL